MIITVGNSKGGVGKTVLALNLAIARALQGKDVWLVDGDRQSTAQMAIGVRSESGIKPDVSCSTYPDGRILRSQVLAQKDKYDDVIIDVGGRDSSALRAALTVCDLLVVPLIPRSYDIWALDDMLEIISEAQSIRDELKCYAVLNCADPGVLSSDNREAADLISEIDELEYLDMPIRRRKAFANAAGAGLSVLELKGRAFDEKAQFEINKLVKTIFRD